jgi:hypothetical protein
LVDACNSAGRARPTSRNQDGSRGGKEEKSERRERTGIGAVGAIGGVVIGLQVATALVALGDELGWDEQPLPRIGRLYLGLDELIDRIPF